MENFMRFIIKIVFTLVMLYLSLCFIGWEMYEYNDLVNTHPFVRVLIALAILLTILSILITQNKKL
jgi:predicted ABC-type exoprotein transport system permease subunit